VRTSLSGNGVAIQALLNLGRVTQDKRYTDAARRAAIWAATQLSDAPEAMPSILANWEELLRTQPVTTAGEHVDNQRTLPVE
jgi:uncharacterized protein YyaL (SSP411 family)